MADPVPPFETERLRALASYKLLDTLPEPEFDQLTTLAADVFQVPIAMVSLVDADRVWHKSMYGFGLVETPRAGAFCASTILTEHPLVVPDATADTRFADSQLVKGESQVRFYAGSPLTTRAGLAKQPEYVSIPQCGHLPHEEKPEEVNRALLSFLSPWKGAGKDTR